MKYIIFLIVLSSCMSKYVDLTDKVDPDIVIINIEEGDRAFIGQVMLTIDSCKPKLIGVDSWFVNEKDSVQDSILVHALRSIDNDILAYTIDTMGQPRKSHLKFRSEASDEGLATLKIIDGFSSHITPISIIDNEEHELFALKIIEWWKPDFENRIEKGKTIPIMFTRTLEQFVHFDGSELTKNKNFNDLHNKVVLLGYIGPSDEDKHFTPIRETIHTKNNKPDTYGAVIIANEIRTILEYKN